MLLSNARAMRTACRAPLDLGRTLDFLGITWVQRCVCLAEPDGDGLCLAHRGLGRAIEDQIAAMKTFAAKTMEASR